MASEIADIPVGPDTSDTDSTDESSLVGIKDSRTKNIAKNEPTEGVVSDEDIETANKAVKDEVSKRNLDSDSGDKFVKQYVILMTPERKGHIEDYEHDANIANTRETMLHMGLRPSGDVVFVGAEDHPDGKSTILTYECPTVPASTSTTEGTEPNYVLAQQLDSEATNDEPVATSTTEQAPKK